MKNALYVLQYASRAEATLNSEKIKPVALSVIMLRLSEDISRSGSQYKILLNKLSLKFHGNLLKVFWVDLKACLGIVLPNQYCLIVAVEN